MHTLIRWAALVVALLSSAPCVAQSVPTNSWTQVFEHGFRDLETLGRVERIALDAPASLLEPIYGRCDLGAPDSVVLIGRTKYARGEHEWLPSFTAAYLDVDRYGRMQQVSAPLRQDTLKARITRAICGLGGELDSFVLEHAGRYVRMDIPSPPQLGMIWFFAESADGRLWELRWSPVLKRIEDVGRARARWKAKSWGPRTISWVLSGNIFVGMVPEMVREAWGDPADINRTTTAHTSSEQWVYGPGTYVYVENGRVAAIQN